MPEAAPGEPIGAALVGRVASGRGEGAGFTRLAWVRDQLRERLGIDPFPGTLNLKLDGAALAALAELKARRPVTLRPPGPGFCDGHAWPVRLAGRLPAAAIVPDVPEYPHDQLELIAALPLRGELGVADGDGVAVAPAQPLRVRAAIFDVDGTLVDSLPALLEVARRAAPDIPIGEDVVRRALNEQWSFWELLLPADAPRRAERIASVHAEARRLWPGILRSHSRAFPGLAESLDALARRGIRLAIFTGSREGSFEPLRRDGLFDRFAAVVTRADVERGKPHPDGLLHAAQQLGVSPAEAVYVGDTPADVAAARAAGMGAVSVLTGAGDSALLSASGPDWIVASARRLPGVLEPA